MHFYQFQNYISFSSKKIGRKPGKNNGRESYASGCEDLLSIAHLLSLICDPVALRRNSKTRN